MKSSDTKGHNPALESSVLKKEKKKEACTDFCF